MEHAFELRSVTRRYGGTVALDGVTVRVPRGSVVGLLGRNGSGKTTLLRHVAGQVLPDTGTCVTLGRPSAELGRDELSRLGMVQQEDRLLEWMRAGQLVDFVASFYGSWDRDLEARLVGELEVDRSARVGALSPGSRQKLALVLAVCHHPELLLLDEPLAALDPMARQTVLSMLLDRFGADGSTIVISSHMLRDIEPVVDRILFLEGGRLVADDPLDHLKERYAEWVVTAPAGGLPERYGESYVLSARGSGRRAHLLVREGEAHRSAFAADHGATIESRPLNLDGLFRVLVQPGEPV
jgi:ABC-2 type transport system ATP-binding protein